MATASVCPDGVTPTAKASREVTLEVFCIGSGRNRVVRFVQLGNEFKPEFANEWTRFVTTLVLFESKLR
jgi:hypothetical protein